MSMVSEDSTSRVMVLPVRVFTKICMVRLRWSEAEALCCAGPKCLCEFYHYFGLTFTLCGIYVFGRKIVALHPLRRRTIQPPRTNCFRSTL
eukprot:1283506-Rhodomonas_salina.1